MNINGLLVGLATFFIIGIFHPIVIKAEFYLGVRCWWIFALAGILSAVLSMIATGMVLSTILGVVAFSSFWSILELVHQREGYVKAGFPKDPDTRIKILSNI